MGHALQQVLLQGRDSLGIRDEDIDGCWSLLDNLHKFVLRSDEGKWTLPLRIYLSLFYFRI